MNWNDGIPPHSENTEFVVRLVDGSERCVRRMPTLDLSNLFFTDCTHPAQNAYCADSMISAWRVVHNYVLADK